MTWNCPCISTVPEPGDLVGKTGFFRNRGNGGTPDVARVGTKISGISGHVAWNSHEIQV